MSSKLKFASVVTLWNPTFTCNKSEKSEKSSTKEPLEPHTDEGPHKIEFLIIQDVSPPSAKVRLSETIQINYSPHMWSLETPKRSMNVSQNRDERGSKLQNLDNTIYH